MNLYENVPDTSLLLPDQCCICGASPVEMGLFGYPWCQACSLRRFVLEWGEGQGYPALRSPNGYACGQGLFHWLITVLCGTEEYVWHMLLAIEAYERERGQPEHASIESVYL